MPENQTKKMKRSLDHLSSDNKNSNSHPATSNTYRDICVSVFGCVDRPLLSKSYFSPDGSLCVTSSMGSLSFEFDRDSVPSKSSKSEHQFPPISSVTALSISGDASTVVHLDALSQLKNISKLSFSCLLYTSPSPRD